MIKSIDNVLLINNKILLDKVGQDIYKVVKVSEHMSYNGLYKLIEAGDTVLVIYLYARVQIDEKVYSICEPKDIIAYIEVDQELEQ